MLGLVLLIMVLVGFFVSGAGCYFMDEGVYYTHLDTLLRGLFLVILGWLLIGFFSSLMVFA